MRPAYVGHRRLPRAGGWSIGCLPWPHSGTAGAFAVHLPHPDTLAERIGRNLARNGRSFGPRLAAPRTRGFAGDASRPERARYSAPLSLGRASFAGIELPVPASYKLAAAP